MRLNAKLTQEQVADRGSINVTHVSNIERGKASPNHETLQRLADGLELPSPAYILLLEDIFRRKKRH